MKCSPLMKQAYADMKVFHGSPTEFNLQDFDMGKAKSGNLGRGIYVTTNKGKFEEIAKTGTPYEKSKYAKVNEAILNGDIKIKEFPSFKAYSDDMKARGFSPGQKDVYIEELRKEGYNGIAADTAGHKNQIILFDTKGISDGR